MDQTAGRTPKWRSVRSTKIKKKAVLNGTGREGRGCACVEASLEVCVGARGRAALRKSPSIVTSSSALEVASRRYLSGVVLVRRISQCTTSSLPGETSTRWNTTGTGDIFERAGRGRCGARSGGADGRQQDSSALRWEMRKQLELVEVATEWKERVERTDERAAKQGRFSWPLGRCGRMRVSRAARRSTSRASRAG